MYFRAKNIPENNITELSYLRQFTVSLPIEVSNFNFKLLYVEKIMVQWKTGPEISDLAKLACRTG